MGWPGGRDLWCLVFCLDDGKRSRGLAQMGIGSLVPSCHQLAAFPVRLENIEREIILPLSYDLFCWLDLSVAKFAKFVLSGVGMDS